MFTTIWEWLKVLDANSIGNFITSFTAIVAIVGLIIQSRITRKQVKLQNFIEYTKRYQEIILNLPENIDDQGLSLEDLPAEERSKTLRYMRAYFDLCFEEYTLFHKKYIDKDLWEIWKGGIQTALSKTAFQNAWEIIREYTNFGADFEGFIERKIEKQDDRVDSKMEGSDQ